MGLVRRSSVGILPLHDVIIGYLWWAPQTLQWGVQCYQAPTNVFPQMQLMVCHKWITPGAAAFLRRHEHPGNTWIPRASDKTRELVPCSFGCCQPRHCLFSPCLSPSCTCWYNHSWKLTVTAPLCWDQPCAAPQLATGLTCPFLFLFSVASPIAAILPWQHLQVASHNAGDYSLVRLWKMNSNAFWRSPLPATLEKML